MEKQGFWVIRTYEAGTIGEKTKFFIPGDKPPKGKRRLKSEIKKQLQNESSAVKRINREIHANFSPKDYLVGLDYSGDGYAGLLDRIAKSGIDLAQLSEEEAGDVIRETALVDFKNYIRRVKRALPEGTEIKYIAVTSDMDGKTGKPVRVHHHVIISAAALDACKEKWNGGSVDYEHIWDEQDHTGLADYLLRQVRRIPDAKKYSPSRNLIHPEPKDRVVIGGAELRVPKHCALLHRSEFKPGRAQYIRYMLPPEKLAAREAEAEGGRADGV